MKIHARRTGLYWAALITLPLMDGCGSETAEPWTTVDSAGVAIATSTEPSWDPAEAWTVAPTPRVRIGVVDGPPHYQLFRVHGVAVLSDDRIVIANGGTNELRFYEPNGQFQHAVGRSGQGPGEFRRLQGVWRVGGDTLIAADRRGNRISVFNSGGQFIRSYRLQLSESGANPFEIGVMEDHSVIARHHRWVGGGRPGFEGVSLDSSRYTRHGRNGETLAILGDQPSATMFWTMVDGRSFFDPVPFSPEPSVAVGKERIAFSVGDSYEIRIVDGDAQLTTIFRRIADPVPVRDTDLAAYRRRRESSNVDPDERAAFARFFSAVPTPSHQPYLRRTIFDSADHLWVQAYAADREAATPWAVFTPNGRWLGEVTLPAGLMPFVITRSAIYGLQRDELDVEQVVVHDIVRPNV